MTFTKYCFYNFLPVFYKYIYISLLLYKIYRITIIIANIKTLRKEHT